MSIKASCIAIGAVSVAFFSFLLPITAGAIGINVMTYPSLEAIITVVPSVVLAVWLVQPQPISWANGAMIGVCWSLLRLLLLFLVVAPKFRPPHLLPWILLGY